MKKWFKNRLRKWFFQKEIDETAQSSLRAANQVLHQEREVKDSNAFLAEQLMNAEKELLSLRHQHKNLEEDALHLKEKLQEISRSKQEKERLSPKAYEEFYKKCARRYENLAVYGEEDPDLKIECNMLATAVLPVKTDEADLGYSLFLPDTGDVELVSGEVARVTLSLSLRIPKGYIGRIVSLPNSLDTSTICVLDSVIYPESDTEVRVSLINWHPNRTTIVRSGTRIAQLVITRVHSAGFEPVAQSSLQKGDDPGSIEKRGGNPKLGRRHFNSS